MADAFAPVEQVTEEVTPDVSQEQGLTPESIFDQTQEKPALIDDFFRANQVEETKPDPSSEPSPVEVPQEGTAEPTVEGPVDNDVKRYQYWQSEADKARNQNIQLQQRLGQIEEHLVQQPQPQVEPEPEQFPAPPSKPGKPRNFSRTDATDDTNSDSARYLDEVDEWRDNMDEYNRLHQQYTQAVMVEEREKLYREREDIRRHQVETENYNRNMDNISNHLSTQYNATPEEVKQFVQVMDDPKNITVDNLFQLYRMQNGAEVTAPLTQTSSNESFEQRKRAQQVPSPMGVVPSQSNAQTTGSDTVMDSMINDYKQRNPFS